MFHRLAFLSGLLPSRLSAEVRHLYAANTTLNLALAMVAIFEPVFLHRNGFSVAQICLVYAAVYALYALLLPLGVKFSLRYGYRRGMAVGMVLWACLYASLGATAANHLWVIAVVAIYALQKSFYWPGFHADFAQYSTAGEQGRELSGASALEASAAVVGPLVGGLIIAFGGFSYLFAVVGALIVAAIIVLVSLPERFQPESMGYGELWRYLASPQNRRFRWTSFAYGEELVALVLWPVAIALVVGEGNSLALGGVASTATLVTAGLTLYVGRLSDYRSPRSIMRYGIATYTFGWLLKPFVATAGLAFATEALSRFAKNTIGVPYMQLLYSEARAEGRVMRRLMAFELGLSLAKMTVALGCAALLAAGAPLWSAFLVAAAFTLLHLAR